MIPGKSLTKEDLGKPCLALHFLEYANGEVHVRSGVDVEGVVDAIASDGQMVKVSYRARGWFGTSRTLEKWVPAEAIALIESQPTLSRFTITQPWERGIVPPTSKEAPHARPHQEVQRSDHDRG